MHFKILITIYNEPFNKYLLNNPQGILKNKTILSVNIKLKFILPNIV